MDAKTSHKQNKRKTKQVIVKKHIVPVPRAETRKYVCHLEGHSFIQVYRSTRKFRSLSMVGATMRILPDFNLCCTHAVGYTAATCSVLTWNTNLIAVLH
mmetsp:Transcript_14897/g.24256  ORF Transcript_14897/g.24256 Transcript_14897/m.24256 type:complete len:99 (-) Transcript_14897:1245-1541(-)